MFGVMKNCKKDIGGTQILEKGRIVKLRTSTDYPNLSASPADGYWSDGVKCDDLDSIPIKPQDLLHKHDLVEVLDPKHDDSLHCNAFLGIYVGVRQGCLITVEDGEGDCWDVSPDEIKIPEDNYEV